MTFSSQEKLKSYYRSEVHSDIRMNLYRKFSPKITQLIDKYIDPNIESTDKISGFEHEIENEVSNYMVRHDFSNIEDIETIVKQDARISFRF